MPVPKTPLLAADCALFDEEGRVLLVVRGHAPFEGRYAIPGGFVEIGETVEDASRRELKEETGAEAGELALVGVYSDPERDPRGHVCSVVFAGRSPAQDVQGADDAAEAHWVDDWRAQRLAFDHRQVLEHAEKLLFGG